MNEVILATTNKGKVKEFAEMLGGAVKLIPIDEATDKPFDVEETGSSFIENARLKAIAGAELTGKTCLADDSGLSIDTLDGRPGIYSARYLYGKDLGLNDPKLGVKRLLEEMEGIENRACRFTCALVIASPSKDGTIKILEETEAHWEGKISHEARGTNGFGYDPIVIPDGYDKTVAELDTELKNQISHRAQASLSIAASLVKMSARS